MMQKQLFSPYLLSVYVFFIFHSLIFSMEKEKQVSIIKNDTHEIAAFYMAHLALGLTIEKVNNFSGAFEKYKPEFLALLEAKELYENNSVSLCSIALQETGITAKKQVTEAYLFLVKSEHRQIIMQKLFHACISDGHEETMKLLFEKGVNLGTIEDELLFLEVACASKHQGIINLLLEKTGGISISSENKDDKKCIIQ